MCACSRAAIPPACAASSWLTGDEVVSLALLRHSDASTAEARAYLKQANAARGAATRRGAEVAVEEEADDESVEEADADAGALCRSWARASSSCSPCPSSGFGKRSPVLTNIASPAAAARASSPSAWARRTAPSIAAFPVEESDDLMLISDPGQTIRVPVASISHPGPRRAGRHGVPGGRGRAGGFGRAHRGRVRRRRART